MELEPIAKTLNNDSIFPFPSSIPATEGDALSARSFVKTPFCRHTAPPGSRNRRSLHMRHRQAPLIAVTEHELNSQTAATLCLASVVDGAPDRDPYYLKTFEAGNNFSHSALQKVQSAIVGISICELRRAVIDSIETAGGKIDYVEIVEQESLEAVEEITNGGVAMCVAQLQHDLESKEITSTT
ncbi:hypothetical protein LXL04_021314 [Taraxacum kok-saghyz]